MPTLQSAGTKSSVFGIFLYPLKPKVVILTEHQRPRIWQPNEAYGNKCCGLLSSATKSIV